MKKWVAGETRLVIHYENASKLHGVFWGHDMALGQYIWIRTSTGNSILLNTGHKDIVSIEVEGDG